MQCIQSEIKKCTIYVVPKQNEKKRKPWITSGIVTSINIKNSLYRESLRNSEMQEAYNNYKKQLNKIIKEAKSRYYSVFVTNLKRGDSKRFWKITNEVLNRKTKNFENYASLGNNLKEVANKLNSHFISIGEDIQNSVLSSNRTLVTGQKVTETLGLLPSSTEEVKLEIDKLKTNPPGND